MRKKRIIIVAISFLVGFLVTTGILIIFQDASADTTTMYGVCEKGSINVRHKPNGHSEICGKLEFGWSVDILGSRKVGKTTWYKVDGITEYGYGWVNGNYLLSSEPSRVMNMYGKIEANGRVATYFINGTRKGWIKPGQEVRIIIYSDEKCYTTKGWIKTKYLNIEVRTDY